MPSRTSAHGDVRSAWATTRKRTGTTSATATTEVAASTTNIQSIDAYRTIIAPTAGPPMKAAMPADSIHELIVWSRSRSSVRYGANELIAVNTGAPVKPNSAPKNASCGIDVARTMASVAGTKNNSAAMTTRRGSNRSTRTPAVAVPTMVATPTLAIRTAMLVAEASNSNAALPQIPTKKAASPPTREMKRAATTRPIL